MKIYNEKVTILLVDDDLDDCQFFTEALDLISTQHILKILNNGLQLVNYMNDLNNDKPHIIFLDLNMPLMNGIETLKEIRQNRIYKDVSVIIYSTSSSEKDIEETLIYGANIYIKKPNDFHELKERIANVLEINWQYHNSNLNRETFFITM